MMTRSVLMGDALPSCRPGTRTASTALALRALPSFGASSPSLFHDGTLLPPSSRRQSYTYIFTILQLRADFLPELQQLEGHRYDITFEFQNNGFEFYQ